MTRPRELVAHAVKAPSSHNTQPWRFEVGPDAIALYADRRRALPVNDPHDRELTISCGAALFNLRVAAAQLGFRHDVVLLPDGSEPDLLARVRLSEAAEPDAAAGDLFAALDKRRTYRGRFDDRSVPPELAARLTAAAATEGTWLHLLPGPARGEVAALVAESDAAQFGDRHWRRELASWMRPRRGGDGLTTSGLTAPVTRFVVRSFDLGKSQGNKDAERAREAPLLAVLGTDGDARPDWLAAGQALERVLLTAAADGIQAGYLNQPCQVAELRPRLGPLVGRSGFPQVCVRLGYPAKPTGAAARRPVEAVLKPRLERAPR